MGDLMLTVRAFGAQSVITAFIASLSLMTLLAPCAIAAHHSQRRSLRIVSALLAISAITTTACGIALALIEKAYIS